jgi:hypothetical protein
MTVLNIDATISQSWSSSTLFFSFGPSFGLSSSVRATSYTSCCFNLEIYASRLNAFVTDQHASFLKMASRN